MLLKIFKNNPLLLLVFGIGLSVILWSVTIMKPGEITHPYTDITLLAPFFDHIHSFPLVKEILGFAILLLEAALWNTIINRHSLLRQSTYFPFFFMLLLLSCRASLAGFYPALISSLFLILAINKLISSYKNEKALSEVFDSGLLVGIATLFYIPSIVFLLLLWIGLFTIRTINLREWTCSVIGFLLPFLFTYTYNLIFYPDYPWYNKIMSEFSYHHPHLSFTWEQIIIMIILSVTALCSLWFFINKATENVLKTQKFWVLMVWYIVIGMGSVAICPVKDSRAFSILALPGSFVLSVYFLKTKARLLPEILFLSLLGGIIISMFF